jgi:hypothetical protein
MANAAGAHFKVLGARPTMLASSKPVIAVAVTHASLSLGDGTTDFVKLTEGNGGPLISSEGLAALHAALDELRDISRNSRQYIAQVESRERTRTGIQSLKVRFNNVFGYYIEISKANLHLAPQDYERKQTLVNAERFTTPELKELERKILAAEEKSNLHITVIPGFQPNLYGDLGPAITGRWATCAGSSQRFDIRTIMALPFSGLTIKETAAGTCSIYRKK